MPENKLRSPANGHGNARDGILGSIRHSLAASRPFDAVRSVHHGQARVVVETPQVSELRDGLAEIFRSNLESVGGICTIVPDENEAAKVVVATINRTPSRRIAISDSELVGRLVRQDPTGEILENASKEELFDCDIGITSAQWAIAETGTLILESEKESHRLTSLVPPVHLCIIRASTIRQTLGEVLELVSRDLSRTITFITGASRTSDIELTLAIGVHGPKELHVIVIENQ